MRLFLMPHTLVGIGLIGAAIFSILVWLFGTDVPGRINSLDISRGKKSTNFNVHYAYTVEGIDYQGSVSIVEEIYNTLQVGQAYPVRVIRAAPSWMPHPRGPGSSTGMVFMWPFMALFWNGLMSVFLWIAWVAPWRMRSLLRHGLATAGVILRTETHRGGKGGPIYRVYYGYQATPLDEGHVLAEPDSFERKMDVTRADYNEAAIGRVVTVIYHPKNPKRSVIYDFAEYEAIR